MNNLEKIAAIREALVDAEDALVDPVYAGTCRTETELFIIACKRQIAALEKERDNGKFCRIQARAHNGRPM